MYQKSALTFAFYLRHDTYLHSLMFIFLDIVMDTRNVIVSDINVQGKHSTCDKYVISEYIMSKLLISRLPGTIKVKSNSQ